jgi:hypothetical protein
MPNETGTTNVTGGTTNITTATNVSGGTLNVTSTTNVSTGTSDGTGTTNVTGGTTNGTVTPINMPDNSCINQSTGTERMDLFDAHVHTLSTVSTSLIITEMDAAGVSMANLYPIDGNDDSNSLQDIAQYPGRFITFVDTPDSPEPSTWLSEGQAFITSAEAQLKTGKFYGIGEANLRYYSGEITPPPTVYVPADTSIWLDLVDLSARYHVPISFHFVPDDTVANAAFERMMNHNKDAILIWCHLGFNNLPLNSTELNDYLLRYPNLYFDTAGIQNMQNPLPQPNSNWALLANQSNDQGQGQNQGGMNNTQGQCQCPGGQQGQGGMNNTQGGQQQGGQDQGGQQGPGPDQGGQQGNQSQGPDQGGMNNTQGQCPCQGQGGMNDTQGGQQPGQGGMNNTQGPGQGQNGTNDQSGQLNEEWRQFFETWNARILFATDAGGGPNGLERWLNYVNNTIEGATPDAVGHWRSLFGNLEYNTARNIFNSNARMLLLKEKKLPYNYSVTFNRNCYLISISSNSSVSGFTFDQSTKDIRFTVADSTGITGSANITIPTAFGGNFTASVDGQNVQIKKVSSSTHTIIALEYSGGIRTVVIHQ